jgi:hypothetical protein
MVRVFFGIAKLKEKYQKKTSRGLGYRRFMDFQKQAGKILKGTLSVWFIEEKR